MREELRKHEAKKSQYLPRMSIPSAAATRPKYKEMIVTAVAALNEKKGSSRQAIVKYIKATYAVGDNADSQVKLSLQRGSVELTHVTGSGASGSFKINKEVLKLKVKAAKQSEKAKATETKIVKKSTKTAGGAGSKAGKTGRKKPSGAKKTESAKSGKRKLETKKGQANKKSTTQTTKKSAVKKGNTKPSTKSPKKKTAAAKKPSTKKNTGTKK